MLTDEKREQLQLIQRCDPSFLLLSVKEHTNFDSALLEKVFELAKEQTRSLLAASAAPAKVDNWQQYAKEGETAQRCIERHRAEQDALLKLYGRAAPAEGRETSAPTCNIAVDLTRELVRSAWVKRFNYVYDRMAEDAELMGFARAIQLECFKTIATGPTKPADEGRTGRTACCPYCTDPHCGGCLATAPTISEAAISIVRKVRDTFRRDMEQGFVTKDKQFAVEMLSQALAEIERIDRAAAKGRSDGPASD